MLRELYIRDFAIIDELRLSFGPGLTVLSGETGAGKTLLVEAIEIVLGKRADAGLIHSSKDRAYLECTFCLQPGERAFEAAKQLLGEELEGGLIVLGREINRSGRNRSFVNGRFANVADVCALGELLVDLHGQHEHQSLLRTRSQLELYDQFIGERMRELKSAYMASYERCRRLASELSSLELEPRARERMLEQLRFEAREIDSLNIANEEEEEELKKEKQVLDNFAKYFELGNRIYRTLNGDDSPGLFGLAADLAKALDEIKSIDPDFCAPRQELELLVFQIEELASLVRRKLDNASFDPERLEQIESRLKRIYDAKRKYGDTLKEVMEYRKRLDERIAELENHEQREALIRSRLESELKSAYELAQRMSEERLSAKRAFENSVMAELSGLDMQRTRFVTRIERRKGPDQGVSALDESGFDEVEFLISANPGELPKPLSKVASGGELSRIMMAIKAVLSDSLNSGTQIFDEVDAGIGGNTGFLVGEKLYRLSLRNQVICITHLAQIGCFADHHYKVEKMFGADSTRVNVVCLDGNLRVEEISRMLSGDKAQHMAERHAIELLEFAAKRKDEIRREAARSSLGSKEAS